MKTTSGFIRALSLLIAFGCSLPTAARAAGVENRVDMQSFLARHDLSWNETPKTRGNSAFLGNGMLGATIWSARDEALHWHLGRNDVYDTTPGVKNRMPIGKLVLNLQGDVRRFQMLQSLFQAEVTGVLETDKGKVRWRTIIPHDRMVGLIEFTVSGTERVRFDFEQLPAVNYNTLRKALTERIKKKHKILDFSDPRYKPYLEEMASDPTLFSNPSSARGETDGVQWVIQPLKHGGGFIVAWTVQPTDGGKYRCAYTVDFIRTGTPTADKAIAELQGALAETYDTLAAPHYAWWKEHFAKSFLSIPDSVVERFYWRQVYKMGAATREDGVVLDEIGPWPRATGWARVWCNINVQIAYHSMMTSNHLELCKPFVDLFDNNRKNFETAVPKQYKTEGALALGRTMDIYGQTGWHWEFGNLAWALHDYWLICRYTGDRQRMKENLFPLLKGSARFMIAALDKDTHGIYHMAPDVSPEYTNERYADTNYNLALLRWNLKLLEFLNQEFNLQDPDATRWSDVLAHLAPYPTDENGMMVAAGVPFEKTHRHYSHLLMFFPLRELDVESPEGRALFRKSYDHWDSLGGERHSGWNAFSFFGAAGMAAWLRDGDDALEKLRGGCDNSTPSTFFGGVGPAIESVLCQTVGTTEMLLQSATTDPGEYRLRIFPAIAKDWKNACFHKLRAEGGFEVSASLEDGTLRFVQITSLAGNQCRVEASMHGEVQALGDRQFNLRKTTDQYGRDTYEVDLRKGETVVLAESTADPSSFVIRPVAVSEGN